MSLLNYYFAPTIIWGYMGIALIVLLRNSVSPQIIAMMSVFFSLSTGVLAGIGDFAFIKQNKRWFFTNSFEFRLFPRLKLGLTSIIDFFIWIIIFSAINNRAILRFAINQSSMRFEYDFFWFNAILALFYAQVIIGSVSLSHFLDSLLYEKYDTTKNGEQDHHEIGEIDRLLACVKKRKYAFIACHLFPILLIACDLLPPFSDFSVIRVIGANFPVSKLLLYIIFETVFLLICFLFHLCNSLNLHHSLVGLSMSKLRASGNLANNNIEALRGYCTLARYNKYGMLSLGVVLFPIVWYVEYWVLTRGI